MLSRAAAIAASLLLAAPATAEPAGPPDASAADDGEAGETVARSAEPELPGAPGPGVAVKLYLHLRHTDQRIPDTQLLYDRALRTFDLSRYLVAWNRERYFSSFAGISLEGRALGGDLRWVLLADTGEVRSERFPAVAQVCSTLTAGGVLRTPTGLDVVGSGNCVLSKAVRPVGETQLGPAQITSNGRTMAEEARKTAFVREAYLAYSFGRAGFATVRGGRKRITVGDGFIYDDYATGAEADLDVGAVGPQWDLAAAFFQPTRDFPGSVAGISPMVALRADYLPSLFEHAGLFAAFQRDRTGSVGELFRGEIVEQRASALAREDPGTVAYADTAYLLATILSRPIDSDASLAWLGTSGNVKPLEWLRLQWTIAALGGKIQRIWSPQPDGGDVTLFQDVSVRGQMASFRAEAPAGPLTASAWVLYLSGSGPIARNGSTYHGFLGISPYVTATNLFFAGGLSETFASRQATAPGVDGRGVIAPGVTLSYDGSDAFAAEAKAAWLVSDVTGPYGGRVYGTEADLQATWTPLSWLLLGAELDVLWPGDFYPSRATVYKTVLAVDVLFP